MPGHWFIRLSSSLFLPMLSKKLKILYVITSLRLGGAERLVTDLSKGFKERGHEAEIFVMDSTPTPLTKELEKADVKIYKGWKGYFNMRNPLCFFKLRSLIKHGDYDIIHSHNSSAQFLTVVASANHPGLVTTEHNTKNARRFIPLFKNLDFLLYSRYHRIIAVSETVRGTLLAYLPGKRICDKIFVIFNGIDLKEYFAFNRPCYENKDKKIITMVASFRKQKDQGTLIKAIFRLPQEYELWLVGDGVTRKESENLARELNISSRVKFLGFRKDVKDLLCRSDIFVLSSHYEGCAISLIEAMAMGLPVIGSNVEGITEFVDAGFLFKEGDSIELAEKIKELTQNENLNHEISNRSKEKSYNFDILNTIARHEELYLELIKKSVQ